VHVELQELGSVLDGPAERRQGVLGGEPGGTPVAEQPRNGA